MTNWYTKDSFPRVQNYFCNLFYVGYPFVFIFFPLKWFSCSLERKLKTYFVSEFYIIDLPSSTYRKVTLFLQVGVCVFRISAPVFGTWRYIHGKSFLTDDL